MHDEILAVSRELIGIANRLEREDHFTLRTGILRSANKLKQLAQDGEVATLTPLVARFMSRYAENEEISLDHAINDALIRWALSNDLT